MSDLLQSIASSIGVIAASVGAIAAGVVAWMQVRREKKKTRQAEREVGFQSEALSFTNFLSEWGECHQEISDLIADTSIDRFLILRAWNGELTPKWTTALFQFREADQKPVSYVHFELDSDYIDRLRTTISRGSMLLDVSNLPECAIRDIYVSEGVKHSIWFHIDTAVLPGTKSRSITYCSFATHNDAELTTSELSRCRVFVGRLKGMALASRDL